MLKNYFYDVKFSVQIAWIVVRAFSKFEERTLETQGVLMFLVNPYIGNMDLIPPGSFEPDPPSTGTQCTVYSATAVARYLTVHLRLYCLFSLIVEAKLKGCRGFFLGNTRKYYLSYKNIT